MRPLGGIAARRGGVRLFLLAVVFVAFTVLPGAQPEPGVVSVTIGAADPVSTDDVDLEERLVKQRCSGRGGHLQCHPVRICHRGAGHEYANFLQLSGGGEAANDNERSGHNGERGSGCEEKQKCHARCHSDDEGGHIDEDTGFYMKPAKRMQDMDSTGSEAPLTWGSKQKWLESMHKGGDEGNTGDVVPEGPGAPPASVEGPAPAEATLNTSSAPGDGPGANPTYAHAIASGYKPQFPMAPVGGSRNTGAEGPLGKTNSTAATSGAMLRCPNDCHQHGYCRAGTCVCNWKWGGPDCGERAKMSECPKDCSGHGACIDKQCFCHPWFTGEDCGDVKTRSACPQDCMMQGVCVESKCVCNPRFYGRTCTNFATIYPNPDDCNGKGALVAELLAAKPDFKKPEDNVTPVDSESAWLDNLLYDYTTNPRAWNHCVCPEGRYRGANCEIPIIQTACDKDCFTHGACMEGRCACAPGYTGAYCDRLVVPAEDSCLENCNERGACENDQCVCHRLFEGESCNLRRKFLCPNDCWSNGMCDRGVCFCFSGSAGADCSLVVDEAAVLPPQLLCLDDCSGNGVCNNGTCICDEGFRGANCSIRAPCPNDCSEHGVCNSTKVCVCHHRYEGADCGRYLAVTACPNDCSMHGVCSDGRCKCHPLYTGDDCGTRKTLTDCPNDCSYRGSCAGGVCTCHPLFEGVDCGRKVTKRQTDCAHDCSYHGVCSSKEGVPSALLPAKDAESQATQECMDGCKASAATDKSVVLERCVAGCIAKYSPDVPAPGAPGGASTPQLGEMINRQRRNARRVFAVPNLAVRGQHQQMMALNEAIAQEGSEFKPLQCAHLCVSSNYINALCASTCMKASSVVSGHKAAQNIAKHTKHRAGQKQIDPIMVTPTYVASGMVWPGQQGGSSENGTGVAQAVAAGPPPTGTCTCAAGWKGYDCAQQSACCKSLRITEAAKCPESCNGRGVCQGSKCICNHAYQGPACSSLVTGTKCEADCNFKGVCTGGECTCRMDFGGATCSEHKPLTTCPNDCSGHGICDAAFGDTCLCAVGWKGGDCSQLAQTTECNGDCGFHGVCGMPGTMSNQCSCHRLWENSDCYTRKDSRFLAGVFEVYPGQLNTRMNMTKFYEASLKTEVPTVKTEELSPVF